ncbi:hypothetical protein [Stieleria mannarensis]|uniref:hypothetical protein n=1 Tax=Stieleria mannarensis TaxID=2755585 RepID=UPI0016014C9C|nr:hypothetical protein [Rhodopirellula sp. JC639]
MNLIPLFFLLAAAGAVAGCASSEPMVIQPQTYQMTEQEQENRQRAQKALAEQRQ